MTNRSTPTRTGEPDRNFEVSNLKYHLTQKQVADMDMLQDAMASLDQDDLLTSIHAHIEARHDLHGVALEQFSDAIRRVAWALQRGER